MKLAVSTLLLFSISASAAPILTAGVRYQTDGPLVSQPVITQGPNGEKLTVAIEQSSPDDHLTARNEAGVKVAEIAVYKSTRTERVSVLDAHVNVKGELVAITKLDQEGLSGGARLFSDNLKTASSSRLSQVSDYPSLVTRTQHDGKDLLAIEVDLGQGANNERPVLLRIVDEANGQVLRDIYTSSVINGRFLTNSRGELKLLVTGYDLFELIDIATGTKTNPLPSRSEKAVASVLETKLGDLVQVIDSGITTLYDPKAFAEGHVKAVRTYASSEISFAQDGSILIEASKNKFRIRDFLTNRQIGHSVARNPQTPSGPYRGQSQGGVRDLLITAKDKIVVIEQPELPMSYMLGSILTYFDLTTGQVLRVRRQKLFDVNARLMHDETGRLVTLEHNWYGQDVDNLLVDLRANRVMQAVKKDYKQIFMQSSKGQVVFGHENAEGRICLAYVSSLQDETCLIDPQISGDAIYNVSISNSQLTVPLANGRGQQTFQVD